MIKKYLSAVPGCFRLICFTDIKDTTGTELVVHQISFKEYKNNLKFNGDNGDGGDTTYSIYIYIGIF